MAQWTDYFRIVTPNKTNTSYETADITSIENFSWYKNVIAGPQNRIQKYKQYDAMDTDHDVSRSLDILAEEIATPDESNNLPFKIHYHNDDNKEVDEGIVMTLKAALRQWTKLQKLEQNVYSIARNTIKYGDCFLRKTSDNKKWRFIDPSNIHGIEIDNDGNILFYHVKNTSSTQTNAKNLLSQEKIELEKIPSDGVVHFSMSDDLSEYAPFGKSLLFASMKAYKQKSLLEDAIVIYRIVRAPERLAFYIDTGNNPPQKQKQILESFKNEARQKRIPNINGGQPDIDSAYNPQSMMENYYFAVTANGRGSRMESVAGGANLGELADLEYFRKGLLTSLRVPSSYINGQDGQGAQHNDGKVGVAFIEELRFANMIKRKQLQFEDVFDIEFKTYLRVNGIRIDESLFSIKLPDPQNFALYRQAALNSDLIAVFTQADGIEYLSKRFILKKYLAFTEDDIQTNEALLRQEKNIPLDENPETFNDIQVMYGDAEPADAESLDEPEDANTEIDDMEFADDVESPVSNTSVLTNTLLK